MNKSDTGINLTNFTESVAILIPLKNQTFGYVNTGLIRIITVMY